MENSCILVDRGCVLLDGECSCNKPMQECKYLTDGQIRRKYGLKLSDKEKNKEQVRDNSPQVPEEKEKD